MKDRYLKLIEACGDDEDLLAFVTEGADKFEGYVHEVYVTDIRRPAYRKMYEGDALRAELTRLDESRHVAHEAAIASIKQLNRLADNLHVPILYEGDLANRYQIADFCMAFVKEVFDARVL